MKPTTDYAPEFSKTWEQSRADKAAKPHPSNCGCFDCFSRSILRDFLAALKQPPPSNGDEA